MQSPKVRSLDVPHRTSPRASRVVRQLKTTGLDSDSNSSTTPTARTPKEKTPKIVERRSPRSPVSEKKRLNHVAELESQLAQLQEDLKKAKDQLSSSESCKRRAQQEADEAKKQLAAMSSKLEDSQQQLLELSASEEARVHELRKISQERDWAWQSELEAVHKKHAVDSNALVAAMTEIQKLKTQLEMVAESEASHTKHSETAHAELQALKQDMADTLTCLENMKIQLKDCQESEAKAKAVVAETLLQLETVKSTAEALHFEENKSITSSNSLILELEQSRALIKSLEEELSKMQSDDARVGQGHVSDVIDSCEMQTELTTLRSEVDQLRLSLETAGSRFQEEQIQSTLKIQCAYEMLEQNKLQSNMKQDELKAELEIANSEILKLKRDLMDKEVELQVISEENIEMKNTFSSNTGSDLETELERSKQDIAHFKANLMDKETELQSIMEENEMLKLELEKKESQREKDNAAAMAKMEAARASEQEALSKLDHATDEREKANNRAAMVTEQLEAAKATNSEMEAELRRLRVQTDQWRKAAEAAAAVLTPNNGKTMEKSGSLDSDYHNGTGRVNSPYVDEMDEDSLKRKNNMLRKIGVLWKKSPKS